MKFLSVFIALVLVSQTAAMAASIELRIHATVLDVNYIQSLKTPANNQPDQQTDSNISVQISGIPQMSINVRVSNDPSDEENENLEYILKQDGRSLILIDEKSFDQDKIGTIQINY